MVNYNNIDNNKLLSKQGIKKRGEKTMLYKIKSRIYALGKKVNDLIPALKEKYGIVTNPSEISNSLSGNLQSPKAQDIVSYSNEIVTAWEIETEG